MKTTGRKMYFVIFTLFVLGVVIGLLYRKERVIYVQPDFNELSTTIKMRYNGGSQKLYSLENEEAYCYVFMNGEEAGVGLDCNRMFDNE